MLSQDPDFTDSGPQKFIEGMGTSATYFKSRGFEQVCSEAAAGLTEGKAKKEFEVRDYFNVDAFVPGQTGDRLNKIYWPSRLEEYFTTFHQTMEVMVKHELTKNGVKVDLLPENLKVACTSFSAQFDGLSPSSIVKKGEDIIVSYDVPLRQHAAKVSFTMNAHKPDTPISMEVKVFGGDEADRFKRTAALASLMAHRVPQISFHNSIPPQINYEKTDGVSFTFDFSRDWISIPAMLERVKVMVKDNTMIDDPARLKKAEEATETLTSLPGLYEKYVVRGGLRPGHEGPEVKQYSEYLGMGSIDDWTKVPEQFFADSLYLNLFLLDHFTKEKNFEMVERIARMSKEGMQQFGLKDYTGEGISAKGPSLYKSAFATPKTSSLAEGIKASLTHLIKDLDDENIQINHELEDLALQIGTLKSKLTTKPVSEKKESEAKVSAAEIKETERKLSIAQAKVEELQKQQSANKQLQGKLGALL